MLTELDTIGFIMSRAQSKLQKRFLQKLKPYGVTPEQWVLFARLSEKEGISPTELSHVSFMDKPYTTRLLEKMEEKGIICKQESCNDKRSSVIFLTAEGGRLRREILPIVSEINDWATGSMSKDETEQLKFLLNKLYDHIKE